MNRITITLTLDLPDGVVPDVTYGDTPNEPPDLYVAPPPVYDKDERVQPMVRPAALAAPACVIHGNTMTRFPAGVNKAGKPYNASWRCATTDCATKPIWDKAA